MKRYAFTLAETLITMGIIGIIATLTLPSLISNYKNKVYVAQLQKVYNQLSNAAAQLMVDEEVDNLNDTYLYTGDKTDDASLEASAGRFLKKYFKVVKDCGVATSNYSTPCNPNIQYKGFNKEDAQIIYDIASYCAAINTGAIICISPFGSYPALVSIDVNGATGPNIMGRDAFQIAMNYRGDIAEHFNGSEIDCGDNPEYGLGCFDKIIADGWKMDY